MDDNEHKKPFDWTALAFLVGLLLVVAFLATISTTDPSEPHCTAIRPWENC